MHINVVIKPVEQRLSALDRVRALGITDLTADIESVADLLEQQRQQHGKPCVETIEMRVTGLSQFALFVSGQGTTISGLAEILRDADAIAQWLVRSGGTNKAWATTRNHYAALHWAITNWLPVPDEGLHLRPVERRKFRDEQARHILVDVDLLLQDHANVSHGRPLPGRKVRSHYKLTADDVARLERILDSDVDRERLRAAQGGHSVTPGLLTALRRRAMLRLALRNGMRAASLATIDLSRMRLRKTGGWIASGIHLKGTAGHEDERVGDWWVPADVWELYVVPYLDALRSAGADLETKLQLTPSVDPLAKVVWGDREVNELLTVLPLWRRTNSLKNLNKPVGYWQIEHDLCQYLKQIHPEASLHCTRSWAARYMVKVLSLEQDYTLEGQRQHVSAPTSVVLRRDDDSWQIVLLHSIPLPEVPSSS